MFRVEEDPADEDEVALVSESFTPPPQQKQASTTTAMKQGEQQPQQQQQAAKEKRRAPPAPLRGQRAADGAAVPAVPARQAVTLETVQEVRAGVRRRGLLVFAAAVYTNRQV